MSQLRKFKKYCEHYMEKFGIDKEWVVYYSETPVLSNRYAETTYWIDSKVATITLNTALDHPEDRLKRMAFHEVCHLVLADIIAMAKSRKFDDELLQTEEHRLINRLENVMLGRQKDWRLEE